MNDFRIATTIAGLLAIGLLGGCQTGGATRKEDGGKEATLEARAAQRWSYLIARDPGKAYDYLTPGYRKTVSRASYAATMGSRPVKWKSASVTKKECEEELCIVYVLLDYEATFAGTGGRPVSAFAPLREKWVKQAAQWYYLPDK